MIQKLSPSLKRFAIITSVVATLVSGFLLIGWGFHIEFIKNTILQFPFIVFIIAFILIFCGLSLIFLNQKNIRVTSSAEQDILLTSIINSSDDAILSKTLEGIIISWNHGAEKIFGYSSKEIIGKHISIIIPPRLLKEEDEILEKIKKGQAISHYETERRRKDGKLIYVSLTLSPIKDSMGNIVMASKILRDISSQREAEQEVLKAYREKEIALSRISDAVVSVDRNWRYTFLNDASLANHPQGREETLGKTLWEVHPELEESVFGKTYHEALNAMKVMEVEDYYAPMDIWFSVKAYPSGDGLTIFYRNITENKKAEQALLQTLEELEKSEVRLNEAQSIAHLGSWEVDFKTTTIKWSDESCRILGVSQGEAKPFPDELLSFIHPDDFESVSKILRNGEAQLQGTSFSSRITRKDGTTRNVYLESRFEFDLAGKPLRLFGILQDVTEAKIAEEERLKMINDLGQRNKDHEQFAYIVSHNLRAPVANIIGFSNALQRPGLNAGLKEKFTEGLFSASNKLDAVIKDLAHILQVSRETSENKQSVCLSDLVDDIRASMSNMIEKEKAEIHYDFAINEIDTIKTFLHSIFYNLISNSIKFRRPSVHPVIDIKSHREDNKIHLVFKDNGLGMDLRKKGTELFGLYKRFHNHIEGKGMGLFMTKTQVETMGGSILVHSIVNEGTEFVIDLPV